MIDIQAVNAATQMCVAQGVRVLNPFLLEATELGHAGRLLELMDPPEGAVVLDAGCGVGELARLMGFLRKDLDFRLLNVSQQQLDLCPDGMERILGSYDRMPLPDACVDVVLFAFSLCHSDDWLVTLREACRVLKPGGQLFIFDMARISEEGSNTLMAERFHSHAYRPAQIMDVARRAGFELADPAEAAGHQAMVWRLRDLTEDTIAYDAAFAGVIPLTLKFHRMASAGPVADAFARHERIAFQFSGGRDSTAALYLLRPYWNQMELYHLDTGDQFPETREVFDQVARDFEAATGRAPQVIRGDVQAVREQFGLASDLVPVDNTEPGRLVSGRVIKIISRYECCARSLMAPMHDRMRADGITLIVRGQRDDEYASPPKRSGDVADGLEVLYPIQSWTGEMVSAYLKDKGLPLAPFYDRGVRRAPECMGCTAWWDEGRAAYMREHHPQAFAAYRDRMRTIRGEIDRQYGMLQG